MTAPEVRQCINEDDASFGCVAVKSSIPNFSWGVFNPMTGGHWEFSDEVVKTWKILS
jgi:hypothetical protein